MLEVRKSFFSLSTWPKLLYKHFHDYFSMDVERTLLKRLKTYVKVCKQVSLIWLRLMLLVTPLLKAGVVLSVISGMLLTM